MNLSQLKPILLIAIPMLLSNITVPLLGLVDTAVIGHLEHAYYLGGVALGSMCITLIYWLCGFLRMSTTGLSAQAYGKNALPSLLQVGFNSALVALVLGCGLILLQQPLLSLCLTLAGSSPEVAAQAEAYFNIRIWGAPAALLNMVLLGWLLGCQNAKAPMLLLIATNCINIALDLLFVLGLDMKVEGAALATVFADYGGLAIGLLICRRLLQQRWQARFSWTQCWQGLERHALLLLMRLNGDIFMRSLALQACFAFITFQGSRLGDNVVAVNAVLLNFLLFASFALDGLAYAIEALAGKAKGEGNKALFCLVNNTTLVVSAGVAVLFSLFFVVFGESLIHMLTSIESIQQTAIEYLPWVMCLPLVAVWCFVFDGIFIAVADGKAMRNSMLVASFGVFFPVWWFNQDWGNHALWLALLAFMGARGLSLAIVYWRAIQQQRWFAAN